MLTKHEKEEILKNQENLRELNEELKVKLKQALKSGDSPFEKSIDEICCDTGTDVGTRYIKSSRDSCESLGWTVVNNSFCNSNK